MVNLPVKKILLVILVFNFVVFRSMCQTNSPIKVDAAYIGEAFSNFSGGIKTGQTYLGKLDFGVGFNTSDLGWWQHGEFYSRIENTHGGNPSANFIGDLQVASNIDNGDYTYLYEMWYKQQVNNLNIQFGIIDLNADYLVAPSGGLFFNSSFGIQSSASINMPVPIFPMNALGINFHYHINEVLSIQTGLWDGNPGDLDHDAYNVKWKISEDEGFLSATELCFNHNLINKKNGSLKLGMLYHSAEFTHMHDTSILDKGNLEFHLIAEQTLIEKPDGEKGRLNAFVQLGYLPNSNINVVPFYLGTGLNYCGLLFSDASDVLGFGLAHSQLSNKLVKSVPNTQHFETALELSYAFSIADKITIQPDLQYIINTGADVTIDDAFVGFVRIIIEQ